MVTEPERPANVTVVRAAPHPPHNLPVSPTPLIGRERDLAAARDLLCRPDVRLPVLRGAAVIPFTPKPLSQEGKGASLGNRIRRASPAPAA